jgi:preprotein translocase SecE subunit
MAKGKKKSKKRKDRLAPSSGGPAVSVEDDHAGTQRADELASEREEDEAGGGRADDVQAPPGQPGVPRRADRAARVGGLSIYKPGQGYYTRVGTAVGAGILLAGLWGFLAGELEVYIDPDKPWTTYIQLGVPTVVVVILGFMVYWVVGKSRRTSDFMILTEGEMKKVSWSTRKEVIGSTKVVIFVVIAMSLLLFVVDYVFMRFFRWIGVLG